MAKLSRDKGARFERSVVASFEARGIEAQKVPLSGATAFAKNDVLLPRHGKSLECKKRAKLPAYLYAWLAGADAVVMAEDRGSMLVVLTMDEYCSLLRHDS